LEGILKFSVPLAAIAVAFLSACASVQPDAPSGAAAYEVIPAPQEGALQAEYRIGPLDVLKITVFQEPDLSLEEVPVDASGNILYPLIGNVDAAGRTAAELAGAIADRLGARYLVNPQVSLIVKESSAQTVTVEGQVTKPGVFSIKGSTSLLQAMASAEGPTRVAKLDEVIVFRRVAGETYAARFDLADIRANRAANPEIRGGDIVVVGNSKVKGALRDALQLAPALTATFVQLLLR
jgi:polysaccharide biosynthesis/export protein